MLLLLICALFVVFTPITSHQELDFVANDLSEAIRRGDSASACQYSQVLASLRANISVNILMQQISATSTHKRLHQLYLIDTNFYCACGPRTLAKKDSGPYNFPNVDMVDVDRFKLYARDDMWYFTRHECANNTVPLEKEIDLGGPEQGEATLRWTLMSDYQLPLAEHVQGGVLIGWLIEPPTICPDCYKYARHHKDMFDLIFTFDKDLLLLDPEKYKFCPFGAPYIFDAQRSIHNKTKLVDITASPKRMTAGHRLRHEVIGHFRSYLDIYGKEYVYADSKLDCCRDYMFQIVIENSKMEGYFTEKLLDCLVSGTIPIYWGDPTIHKWFDIKGFLIWENMDQLRQILKSLSKELYDEMLPAVRRNFEFAKQYSDPIAYIWNNGVRSLVESSADLTTFNSRAKNKLSNGNSRYTLPTEPTETAEALHFQIVIPSHEAAVWISKTIHSLMKQTHTNWDAVIVDGCSSDPTVQRAREAAKDDSRIQILEAEHDCLQRYQGGGKEEWELSSILRGLAALNASSSSSSSSSSNSIVVFMSGGDWLFNSHVLQYLANVYRKTSCWVTYGSHIDYPTNGASDWFQGFDPDLINDNNFRAASPVSSLHLRSIRRHLVDLIPSAALQYQNGSYYTAAAELAFMLPALEMSGDRIQHIKEIMYVRNVVGRKWNVGDHIVDVSWDRRVDAASRIRLSPKFKRLVPQARIKPSSPQIWISSPNDGETFLEGGNNVILKVHTRDVWMPEEGSLAIYIGSNRVYQGETTSVSVSMNQLEPGEYDVAAVILDVEGEPLDIEATVRFTIVAKDEHAIINDDNE